MISIHEAFDLIKKPIIWKDKRKMIAILMVLSVPLAPLAIALAPTAGLVHMAYKMFCTLTESRQDVVELMSCLITFAFAAGIFLLMQFFFIMVAYGIFFT